MGEENQTHLRFWRRAEPAISPGIEKTGDRTRSFWRENGNSQIKIRGASKIRQKRSRQERLGGKACGLLLSVCSSDLRTWAATIDQAFKLTALKLQRSQAVRGISAPPYTFARFNDLPLEIQLRIWSAAARTSEPQTFFFLSPGMKLSMLNSIPIPTHLAAYSHELRRFPILLHVCQKARAETLKVYTKLACPTPWSGKARPLEYVNTLYNNFYLGGDNWSEFKVLADLVMSIEHLKTLKESVVRDLHRIRNIHNLTVDINIFGDVPLRLWTEFPRLEKLTIALYPFDVFLDRGLPIHQLDPTSTNFLKPKRNSGHGRRATWITEYAIAALQTTRKARAPDWKMPIIDVVVRDTGNPYVDFRIKAADEYGDISDESEDEILGSEIEETEFERERRKEAEDAEKNWFSETQKRMAHTVSPAQIMELRRKYYSHRDDSLEVEAET
jgi:hypothetical protein